MVLLNSGTQKPPEKAICAVSKFWVQERESNFCFINRKNIVVYYNMKRQLFCHKICILPPSTTSLENTSSIPPQPPKNKYVLYILSSPQNFFNNEKHKKMQKGIQSHFSKARMTPSRVSLVEGFFFFCPTIYYYSSYTFTGDERDLLISFCIFFNV